MASMSACARSCTRDWPYRNDWDIMPETNILSSGSCTISSQSQTVQKHVVMIALWGEMLLYIQLHDTEAIDMKLGSPGVVCL